MVINTACSITEDISWVGVNDHSTDLFEALWPLPKGISYNSYIINDDKVALIDSVKPDFLAEHRAKIRSIIGKDKAIDYLVINHMEPDHTGAIDQLRSAYPDIKIVGNHKTLEMLSSYYDIDNQVFAVKDGGRLSLGRHELMFQLTPMVHWPETMMTYDAAGKVLFTGDVFGSYGAVDEGLFDDEVQERKVADEVLRYFSNIIGRYGEMVLRAIDKIKTLETGIVAPTHGIIWRKKPQRIIELYDCWSRHQTEPGVVIVFASMYGNTRIAVEALTRELVQNGLPVTVHNLSHSHASFVLRDIWRYGAAVLACPTYNTELFPLMDDLVRLLENKRISNRLLGIVGSYGWSGGAAESLRQFAEKNKWELVEPVIEFRGSARKGDMAQTIKLAGKIAEKLRETDKTSE